MNILDNLFNNPAIKKAALGNLIKVMRENHVSQVVVKLNDAEEIDLEFVKDDCVIIPASDFETYKQLAIEKLNSISDE